VEPERDTNDAELIARELVDVLRNVERPATRGLLTSEEAARLLRVDVEWVRDHRVALGAVKLGDGPKARLRFPRESIDAYLAARKVGPAPSAEAASTSRPPASRRRAENAPSLSPRGQPVIDW
jgi:helix-turn-helix protein